MLVKPIIAPSEFVTAESLNNNNDIMPVNNMPEEYSCKLLTCKISSLRQLYVSQLNLLLIGYFAY